MLKVVGGQKPFKATVDFGEDQLNPEELAVLDDRGRRRQSNEDYLSAHNAEFAVAHIGQLV